MTEDEGAGPDESPRSTPGDRSGAAHVPADSTPRGPHPALLSAIVATVALVVFAASIGGPWILDDHNLVELNPYIHSFSYWRHWLTTDLWDVSMTTVQETRVRYYRPLVTASYAIDWVLGGGSPVIFHVTNLLWQAAASALAFFALRRWLGAWLPALLAALVFVVHPTKAESVAWIAGRTDVMCCVWLLVASAGMAFRISGRRGGLALEVAGTVLAYLTKETAIVLPAFAVVETWVLLGRPAIDMDFSRKALRNALPQLGVAAGYLVLRQILMPVSSEPAHAALPGTGNRLELVLETFGRTAELAVLPRHLMIQQGLLRIDVTTGRAVYSVGYMVLGASMLLAIGAGAWFLRQRLPGATLGLLFFLVTLLPTANLIPTRLYTVISERFLYVPTLGLSLAIGVLVLRAARLRQVAIAASALVIVGFGTISVRRALDYSSRERFWKHEAAVNPWSYSALLHLAYVDIDAHRYDDALRKLSKAHALAHRWFPDSGVEVDVIMEAVELLAHLTPDAQRARLTKLDRFVTDSMQSGRKHSVLELDKPPLHAVLALDNPIVKGQIKSLLPRLWSTHADIQSRIGRPEVAARAATRAWKGCKSCSATAQSAAVALARTAHYDEARRILDSVSALLGPEMASPTRSRIGRAYRWHERAQAPGPAGVLARARELSVLGAYGRAFDLLSPHEDDICRAPGMVMGYAELAWRAGHPDVARRVLENRIDAAEIRRLTSKWSERMGWLPSHQPTPRH